jgi:hypothetical protein
LAQLNLTNCQLPGHSYKKVTREHVEIPNHLNRQFAVTEPNQVWCIDLTYIWTGHRWAYKSREQAEHVMFHSNLVAIIPVGNFASTYGGTE